MARSWRCWARKAVACGNDKPDAMGVEVTETEKCAGSGKLEECAKPQAAQAPMPSDAERLGEVPEDCYILFPSATDGWRLYELARDAEVGARIAPTPRAARSSCGVSLLVACEDVEGLVNLAHVRGVEVEGTARLPRRFNPRRDRFC